MAKIYFNEVTHGLQGKFGDLMVFKQVNGKTIVAKRPAKTGTPPSSDQLLVQQRFKDSAAYAKTAIQDPVLKERYSANAKKGQSAYNRAFADFFNPPTLSNVKVEAYQGVIGNPIIIRATDDFELQDVNVQILDPTGQMIETGQATLLNNGLDWQYLATVSNAVTAGSKIVFTATDLPGNSTTLQVEI